MIGYLGFDLHHFGSLVGAVEFAILSALACRVGYFEAHIRETLLYK